MNAKNLLIGSALVIATAAITAQVVSQHDKGGGMPDMTPEEKAQFDQWMAYATPGEQHELLQTKVGKWSGTVKHWMAPGTEAETSNFTADVKSLWDGRYLTESVEGEGMMPGQTFLGKSVIGYDNLKKKYFWVWLDNMGTGVMHAEGSYNPSTKTFSYTYDHPDFMTGKFVKGRSVEKWINNDQVVAEMYGPGPDGKEFKMMELTYSRVK